jgi:hypothetical protein
MLTIATLQGKIALALYNEVKMVLPLDDFLAHSVDFCKFCDICCHEFDLSILVQSFTLFNDTVCGCLTTAHNIYMWGERMFDECFSSRFTYA